MIVREWRGRAAQISQDRYPEHFRNNVMPALKRINGFAGAQLCKERQGNDIEYLVLTRWQSMDAIRSFAGSDYSRAVVEPEAASALIAFDPVVRHYEVVEEISL
jgi:heme-degrading monooxygenase HmoA